MAMVETAVLEAETREPYALVDVEHTEAPASRRVDLIEASAVERASRNGIASGETADAEFVHCARGWRIRVIAIEPEKYPQFRQDRDHPCLAMAPAARIAELDECGGMLWARTCAERVQQRVSVAAPSCAAA
jgi:hypothetical protein